MVIKARLDGHPFDLDSLSRSFRDGDPHVNKDQEGYYLGASALDDLINDGGQLYATAATLQRQMNGVARALDCDYRPVQLVGRFSDGERTHHVAFVVDVAEARDSVTAVVARVDGMDARQPLAPGPRYLDLVDDHPDVAEVLAILGKPVSLSGSICTRRTRSSVGMSEMKKTSLQKIGRPSKISRRLRHLRIDRTSAGRRPDMHVSPRNAPSTTYLYLRVRT